MRNILILCLALFLGGCSLAPEYVRPQMGLPTQWSDAAPTDLEIRWWQRFNDPVLDALVMETLTSNKNLEVAIARVDQARATLGLSRANQFPTLASAFDATRSQASRMGTQAIPSPINREFPLFNLGLQAAWEMDLWGKFRNSTAAAREALLATEEAQRGVLLSLASQTCIAYFNLRNFDLQLEIAARTLKTREDALEIYTARFDEGLISELDLLRAKTEVETVRAIIYTTRYQIGNAESALLLLAGRSPREIFSAFPPRGLGLDDIPAVPQLPAGIPSQVLERRPDIQAAEAQLRAANFNVGVAKAEWFPSISLTGQLGYQSSVLPSLFEGATGVWGLGSNVSLPLLTFGRISRNVEVSEARVREAIASYGLSVQTAFQEIRNALVIQENTQLVSQTMEATIKNLAKAVGLAQLRYENGYSSYLEVLDAERSLFQTEIELANVRASHLTSIVNVCVALGGGWTDSYETQNNLGPIDHAAPIVESTKLVLP